MAEQAALEVVSKWQCGHSAEQLTKAKSQFMTDRDEEMTRVNRI
jgi:hypothetical protein